MTFKNSRKWILGFYITTYISINLNRSTGRNEQHMGE